jgi:NADPH:quinone reductase-like Zn-dependent oxidoreductase
MKASYFETYGPPEVLTYGDVPDPVLKPDDVIVDIHAVSVNAADWKTRSDYYRDTVRPLPHILGRDFSGVVSEVGSNVQGLRVGDEVFAVCDATLEGSYAEKIAIKGDIVARKPARSSHIETAAMALTGLTATNAIEQTLKLQKGETILIQGGAGGVAGFAIQLAKHIGARVITTASQGNHEYLYNLGAEQVIDYNTTDFTKVVSNCDAVLDTVGGDVAMRSFSVIRPGGRAAFVGGGRKAPESPRPDVASLRPAVGRGRAQLERIVALVESNAVRPPAITVFSLSEAVQAHKLSESRHLQGKIVLKVR